MRYIHGAITFGLAALLSCCLCGCDSQTNEDAKPSDKSQADAIADSVNTASDETNDAAPEITARELAEEFQTDSAAASEKYEQQTLLVTGTTADDAYVNQGLDYSSLTLIGLEVPEESDAEVRKYYVSCRFDGAEKAKAIKKGNLVRLRGKFVNNIAGQILLHQCEILE